MGQPHQTPVTPWDDLAVQRLVRYEALFELLDDLATEEDIGRIAQRAARQLKYFSNVTNWRLVLAKTSGYLTIDGFRGDASLNETRGLSPWDAHHWQLLRPCLVRLAECAPAVPPPEHLSGQTIDEIHTLPILRQGRCIGLLSAATRHAADGDLDKKFIRLFANCLADRLVGLLLREEAMATLIERATHDHLTGTLNRGAIMERLVEQLALTRHTGQPLSLVFADIDLFKDINDRYGHAVGDTVISEVAWRMLAGLRSDDRLGRYGGEEFLLVLYPCDSDEALAVAERHRRAIADTPFPIGGAAHRRTRVTVSLGTASTDRRADIAVQSLLKLADDALYRAKRHGRNCVRGAR